MTARLSCCATAWSRWFGWPAAARVREGISRLCEITRQRLAEFPDTQDETALLEAAEAQAQAAEYAFQALAEQGRDTLTSAQAEAADVATAVIEAMGTVQFQDVVRQRLEHVCKSLSNLEQISAELAGSLVQKSPVPSVQSQLLDAMEADYVMQSQRSAHDNAASAHDAGAAIELL